MFADDTKLYREVSEESNHSILQDNINKLFESSKKWLLRFYPDECKVLPFSNRTHKSKPYTMLTYERGLVKLETVKCEKYVGVTIGEGRENFV